MFLKSIYLKNFKRFKELTLDFPGDITIVRGPNEQGKSTLVLALEAGIFCNPAVETKAIEALRSWGSDELPQIKMVWEREGKEYELWKDFQKKEAYLLDREQGEKIEDSKRIREFFRLWGGYRNPKLFGALACVKQESVGEIHSGTKEIDKALEEIVSSGSAANVSATEIVKRVQKRLGEIQKGIGDRLVKTPGVLKALTDSIARLRKEQQAIEMRFRKFEALKKELDVLNKDLETWRQEGSFLESQYKKNVRFFEIQKEKEHLISELQEISAILDEAAKTVGEIEEFKRKKKEYAKFEALSLDVFQRAKEEIETLQAMREKYKERLAQFRDGKIFVFRPWFFGVLACGICVGLLGFFITPWFFLAWVSTGIFSLLSAFLQIGIESLRKRDMKHALRDIEQELRFHVASLGHVGEVSREDLVHIEQRFHEYEELLSAISHRELALKSLLRGKSLDALSRKRTELIDRLAILEAEIARDEKFSPPTREEAERLEQSLQKARAMYEETTKALARKDALLQEYSSSFDTLLDIEEEIEMKKEELQSAKRQERIFELLIEYLKGARHATLQALREQLEIFMSNFISRISGGKYTKIQVGDDLSIRVWSPEKQKFVMPKGTLSQGALDQVYLVARFAFLKIFSYGAERRLIVLDDPLYTFDAERKSKTRFLLEELSKNFQIILLTHSREYDTWGIVRELL